MIWVLCAMNGICNIIIDIMPKWRNLNPSSYILWIPGAKHVRWSMGNAIDSLGKVIIQASIVAEELMSI